MKLYAFNHEVSARALIKDQGVTSAGIVIGKDVWIGANACITDGVTKDVAANEIVAGVPAKKIGVRQ